jgi:hypothetical protein
LAILLDSFLVEGDADELTEEEEREKAIEKEKRKEEKEKNRIRKIKKLGMSQMS